MNPADQLFFSTYHNWEEFLVFLICFSLAGRLFKTARDREEELNPEQKSRLMLVAGGFILLGLNSLIHAYIHAAGLNLNLLYHTLLGYCFGLLILIIAISASRPQSKIWLLLLYPPLLILMVPGVYEIFPLFDVFRPLVWISIAFLAGHLCILHVVAYYRLKGKRILFAAAGFLFICVSAIFLFFPASIGSSMWLHGHLFRPIGFIVLFLAIHRTMYSRMGDSIIYRVLTSFSLLMAIPMILFGTIVLYVNLNAIDIEQQRLLIFLLMLAIFTSVLIVGLGTIIKLVHPILRLKESVDKLVDEGLNRYIEVESNDEIGELSNAFNEMVVKLSYAVEEQERLCRLAATGELAATLAHEIKNPLNAISGAAAYIGKNYEGTLIREFTGIISAEVARINKLTGTLLDFARPLTLEKAPSDIRRLVREVGTLLDGEARERQIDLHLEVYGNIPEICFDYSQIKQVLINLII
ncbi:MAG: histidine kinase dimerization/phospho-acceptor domain-containing protein, partial [Desulfobulbaceae bacterium]